MHEISSLKPGHNARWRFAITDPPLQNNLKFINMFMPVRRTYIAGFVGAKDKLNIVASKKWVRCWALQVSGQK